MGCHALSEQVICSNCIGKIDFIKAPYCTSCGIGFSRNYSSNICAYCLSNPPLFSQARSVFLYNENSKKLIQKFKFCDAIHPAKLYGQWMVSAGHDILPSIDLIVPVPLHRKRLFLRGYNQSSLLASVISNYTNIPVNHILLHRIKNTLPQSQLLSPHKRILNVKRAFKIYHAEDIKNKTILLIDDVITTGATVTECTKILMQNHASSVHVLTLSMTSRALLR